MSIEAIIFSVDGVLVKPFTTYSNDGIEQYINNARQKNIKLAVAANQAGPMWRWGTSNRKYPLSIQVARNLTTIAARLHLEDIPWYISTGDERLIEMTDPDSYIAACRAYESDLNKYMPEDFPFFCNWIPTWRKPQPAMLTLIAQALDLSPNNCLHLGSVDDDRLAAAAAGMQYQHYTFKTVLDDRS